MEAREHHEDGTYVPDEEHVDDDSQPLPNPPDPETGEWS